MSSREWVILIAAAFLLTCAIALAAGYLMDLEPLTGHGQHTRRALRRAGRDREQDLDDAWCAALDPRQVPLALMLPAKDAGQPAALPPLPAHDEPLGPPPRGIMCQACAAGWCGRATCRPGDGCTCPCSTWAHDDVPPNVRAGNWTPRPQTHDGGPGSSDGRAPQGPLPRGSATEAAGSIPAPGRHREAVAADRLIFTRMLDADLAERFRGAARRWHQHPALAAPRPPASDADTSILPAPAGTEAAR